MKIINRLYIKVVLNAFILITFVISIYYIDIFFQHKLDNEKNILMNKHQENIKILKKEIIVKKKKNKKQKQKISKLELDIKDISKRYENKLIDLTNYNKGQIEKITNNHKKEIMKTVHYQLINELKYAPYLLESQLQAIIKDRFLFNNINIKIKIYEKSTKTFNNIKVYKNKTESIIKDNRLLEIKFDGK
jgi:hypothetical protein